MSDILQAHRAKVGRRIRSARKRAGLSHDALAGLVGSSRQHLIKLEKGMHFPGDAMAAAIAQATGVTVEYLAGEGDDDEEPHPAMSLDQLLRDHVRALVRDEVRGVRP